MTDKTELKRLADSANAVTGNVFVDIAISSERGPNQPEIDAVKAFVGVATPAAVLALIAENEAMAEFKAHMVSLRETGGFDSWAAVLVELDRLKAENEALRDDIEQTQYDTNAWRNGEESVWIEVFNSEGDDPFISAISGQITIEQLALIQGEILEYREDYFEKGSGLYVFRCAHHQAHHDNVGMTEPAHWETDFESYSPFPWEEEGAAMGKGEKS